MSEYKIADKIGIYGDGARIGKQIIYTTEVSPSGKPLQRPPKPVKFIDRKDELEKLSADLQPGKVVTLWGAGGMGKTALASEAVWRLTADGEPPSSFPDGVIYHDFYFQPKADIALEAIARAFREEPKPTPREAALRALGGRAALLLLDGAENADDLGAVLNVRGNCGVIVTSRRRRDAYEDRQELKPLETDDAVELLQAWGKEHVKDDAAAEKIWGQMGTGK